MNKNTLCKDTQDNKYTNLIVEESDDNSEQGHLDNLFISSESSESSKTNKFYQFSQVNKKNNLSKNSSSLLSNTKVQNATTGMDVFDNNEPNFIDEDNQNDIENSSECQPSSPNSTPPSSPKNRKHKNTSITGMVENMLNKDDNNINGWDNDANITITNWYKTFKQQSFIYQYVLDKNRKISDRLAITSIISSALLGIFSGFKLWVENDVFFQTVSNILLMLFNFLVALITATSKRYIDDKRNETLRTYVEEVDIFIGELSAQVLNSPVYRMNADEFFNQNNSKYTKLISSAPNLSINEINEGKKQFAIYKEHCHYNV